MKRSPSALACGLLVLLLAAACIGQTVHIANYSGHRFDGWKRCTVDVMPPHKA